MLIFCSFVFYPFGLRGIGVGALFQTLEIRVCGTCLPPWMEWCSMWGNLFHFVNNVKVKFARKQFHNSLHDFAAKQIETFKKAVDDVSVGEACEMRHNLLELCLIFTTVFVLYKQEVETVNILESDERESWNRLVQLQEDQFAAG